MYFSNAPFKVSLLAAAIALTGCGGDSSSSGGSDDPKDGFSGTPVSGHYIGVQGGAGNVGDGGEGGTITIEKTNSVAQLSITKEGNVDSTYTLPAQELNLGTKGVTVTGNKDVLYIDDEALPASDELYMVPGSSRLYISGGAGAVATDDQEVTGLVIEEGAVLTLTLPSDGFVNLDNTISKIYIRNDIQNNGLIQTAFRDDEVVRSEYAIDIELNAAAYYGTGSINTAGDKGLYIGQKGGDIAIKAYTIQNSGLLNSSGAAGQDSENDFGSEDGGRAGDITLDADVFIENTGELRAIGGVDSTEEGGEGGMGGDVSLAAMEVYNTGAISVDHGSGDYVFYSNQAEINLVAGRTLINTAALSAKGGQATGDDGRFSAGKGGSITLEIEKGELPFFDGRLVNTGELNADGGSVTGKSDGDAGNGGNISILVTEVAVEDNPATDSYPIDLERPTSNSQVSVAVTGNLSAKGGDTDTVTYTQTEGGEGSEIIRALAGDGGEGGSITIDVTNSPSSTVDVRLVGYDAFTAHGGDGNSGAPAGTVSVMSDTAENTTWGSVPALAGPINMDVDVFVNGGEALAEAGKPGETLDEQGIGGAAGNFVMAINNPEAYLQADALNLSFSGDVQAFGGRSFDLSRQDGATGGSVAISAPHAISVTGSLILNGGSDEHEADGGDTMHEGANGGMASVMSESSSVAVDATIEANGGNGTLKGGDAGNVLVLSKTASTLSGTITLNGGNSAASEVDAYNDTEGGDAGSIMMISAAYNSELNATVTAGAGSGDKKGEDRVIYVDADCQSDNCGVGESEDEEDDEREIVLL